jgi:hypothetical protein
VQRLDVQKCIYVITPVAYGGAHWYLSKRGQNPESKKFWLSKLVRVSAALGEALIEDWSKTEVIFGVETSMHQSDLICQLSDCAHQVRMDDREPGTLE